MTFAEFEPIMGRLVTKFGTVIYDSRKVELIWQKVQSLEPQQFEKIIDHFVAEDIKAKLSDFEVLLKPILNARKTHNYEAESQEDALARRQKYEAWKALVHEIPDQQQREKFLAGICLQLFPMMPSHLKMVRTAALFHWFEDFRKQNKRSTKPKRGEENVRTKNT